ncbi:MAG: hypothetical protein JW734_01415 [Candidatus Omnitrophica bacterium]|nr:hypothetical protein [Candidatus Omnitrophota bacterium]
MMTKKTYQKPALSQVDLVPQEALLTGCKRSDGSNGKSESCPPVNPGKCSKDSGS